MQPILMNSSKPSWLKVRLPSDRNFFQVAEILKKSRLHTICESAKCPNTGECWSKKTATFMILGDICTRKCGFCAVNKGTPLPPSANEPQHVAEAVRSLGLQYAVVTSVTRDDLPDGGASRFAQTVREVRKKNPAVKVEVLIPDFNGDETALAAVLEAKPDVLNHNLETTESFYPVITRPSENYRRSLRVLETAKKQKAVTKSGLMVGLGEDMAEILETFSDLRKSMCDLLTIGQYLQPSKTNVPVKKYYAPHEFVQLKTMALEMGFLEVESGPLVRSSFQARKMYISFQEKGTAAACAI